MTVFELADRMDDDELTLWLREDLLRDEERRDKELEARAKARVKQLASR